MPKMNIGVILSLVAIFKMAASCCCYMGWEPYEGSCYRVVTEKMTWQQANRSCLELGAALAIPDTLPENAFMLQLILQMTAEGLLDPSPGNNAWLGCNDLAEEGNWSHCPPDVDNWQSGQPDNVNGADCGQLKTLIGRWGDSVCTREKISVCEARAPPAVCANLDREGRLASSRCRYGNVTRELPVRGLLSCLEACRGEPRCRSFNLLDIHAGYKLCQLNNASDPIEAAADGKFKTAIGGCYFFQL